MASSDLASAYVVTLDVRGRIGAYLPRAGINVVAAADVARGHRLALERGRAGDRYLLGGDDLALRDAFTLIARSAGRRPPRVPVPWTVALAAAHAVDLAGRAVGPRVHAGQPRRDPPRAAPAVVLEREGERELGYTWRPAEQAIAEAVSWFQDVT